VPIMACIIIAVLLYGMMLLRLGGSGIQGKLVTCPGCHEKIDDQWELCPHCARRREASSVTKSKG